MTKLFLICGALIVFTMLTSMAQNPTEQNLNEKNVALDGYDPVSYFTQKKAIKGKASIVAEHAGARYQFSTQENKNLFVASPTSYKPQYGGWCAYAMGAKGEKVEIDPETFKILDGKLYLFYNRFFNNTLDSWNENEAELKANADRNWIKITKR